MKMLPYSVSDQITYNMKPVPLYMQLYRITDISHTFSRNRFSNAFVQRLPGDTDQILCFLVSIANDEGVGVISHITIQYCSTIYRNNISFLQHPASRNSVYNLIINGNTQR
ncbi:hypothetical protein SDC9_72419 [bioreactor metagenome]|uniref:Uncharacterized protein n=1 Tax=bioreactor metagenome TaxID=1076179 RepID=A0A644YD98_9ZZZZ